MRRGTDVAMLAAAMLLATFTAVQAGVKTISATTAPDLQPGAYSKILVLARITEEGARRILEDTVVAKLKKEKVDALAAHQVLVAEDLASSEAIHAKAEELGVDSGIVFTVVSDQTQAKPNPTVSVGVGVPVRVGPFSVFVGGSVPVGGGGATNVRIVQLKSELHAKSGTNPRWTGTFAAEVKEDAETIAEDLAKQTIKQLKKAKVIK